MSRWKCMKVTLAALGIGICLMSCGTLSDTSNASENGGNGSSKTEKTNDYQPLSHRRFLFGERLVLIIILGYGINRVANEMGKRRKAEEKRRKAKLELRKYELVLQKCNKIIEKTDSKSIEKLTEEIKLGFEKQNTHLKSISEKINKIESMLNIKFKQGK